MYTIYSSTGFQHRYRNRTCALGNLQKISIQNLGQPSRFSHIDATPPEFLIFLRIPTDLRSFHVSHFRQTQLFTCLKYDELPSLLASGTLASEFHLMSLMCTRPSALMQMDRALIVQYLEFKPTEQNQSSLLSCIVIEI